MGLFSENGCFAVCLDAIAVPAGEIIFDSHGRQVPDRYPIGGSGNGVILEWTGVDQERRALRGLAIKVQESCEQIAIKVRLAQQALTRLDEVIAFSGC